MKSIAKKEATSKEPEKDWLGRPIRAHAQTLAARPPRPTTNRTR